MQIGFVLFIQETEEYENSDRENTSATSEQNPELKCTNQVSLLTCPSYFVFCNLWL